MPSAETLQQDLKQAQAAVRSIDERRQQLLGDQKLAEHKVQEAINKLIELGVEDAGKLTVEQLAALRDKTRADLITNLTAVQGQITEANQVLAEYDAIAAA